MHFRFWVQLRILRSDWIVHPPSFPLRSFLACAYLFMAPTLTYHIGKLRSSVFLSGFPKSRGVAGLDTLEEGEFSFPTPV